MLSNEKVVACRAMLSADKSVEVKCATVDRDLFFFLSVCKMVFVHCERKVINFFFSKLCEIVRREGTVPLLNEFYFVLFCQTVDDKIPQCELSFVLLHCQTENSRTIVNAGKPVR
jgi:hypothetical protein